MADTVAPVRTDEQRRRALELANQVRSYRAALKRDISAGVTGRSALDVIRLPLELEQTWKVYDVILALPKVGRTKANRILMRERVSPSKTVGGLSERQRAALLLALLEVGAVRRSMSVSGGSLAA